MTSNTGMVRHNFKAFKKQYIWLVEKVKFVIMVKIQFEYRDETELLSIFGPFWFIKILIQDEKLTFFSTERIALSSKP